MSRIRKLLRKPLRALRAGSKAAPGDPRRPLHYLHIGKTAGSQFETIADRVNETSPDYRILKRAHGTTLIDLPEDDGFLFSIRRPDTRFMSGFYSRKRKGRPRYDNEWSRYEAAAFGHFEHANDLAEALFEDSDAGFHALCALESIGHCARTQIQWFHKAGSFFEIRPPVAILRQEAFDQDIAAFLRKIGCDPEIIRPAEDATTAHRTNYEEIPPLSEKARRNLHAWYRADFEFYKWCEHWIAQNQAGPCDT